MSTALITGASSGSAARSILCLQRRFFPFEATNEAMAYLETGRSKGKIVVKIR
jgi:hypothetical protein